MRPPPAAWSSAARAARPPAAGTRQGPPTLTQARRRVAYLLPGFGLAFGGSVLILGAVEYAYGADQSPRSLLLRLVLVALGACAHRFAASYDGLVRAGAFLYLTHGLALAANAVSVPHGLHQAMAAFLTWLACAGFLEPRPWPCLRMLAPAALAYAALGLAFLPWPAVPALLAACAAGLALAVAVGAAIRRLWCATWQYESALLYACQHDALSGALARGHLMERLAVDAALARRHGRPLAVAMLDLDEFKQVNDRHGHAAGDRVICALVATCIESLRATDYVGRVGGEEFVCVMPETGAADALACLERIRTTFSGLALGGGGAPLRCTVSIGARILSGHEDVDTLLRDADAALYRAKAGGRNRTILARGAVTPA
jgi:diguanylate cyclase (GGDEF)-like protein